MEATADKFAYRCLPLAIANQHGWEVCLPQRVSFVWNGGNDPSDLKVIESNDTFCSSMFGYGILSFHIGHIITTSEGLDLFVTGSPNLLKPHIQPLSGIIETSWSPYTFTMNWKLTEINRIVQFQAGEPICFFFPISRKIIEEIDVVVDTVDNFPDIKGEEQIFSKKRAKFIEQTKNRTTTERWQKDYYQGKLPSGGYPVTDDKHRTKLKLKF